MSALDELALRLAHDVGKYVTRIARNVEPDDVPEALVPMLLDDVYRLDGAASARAVTERLVAESGCGRDAVPAAAWDALARLDALRSGAEAADADAIGEVVRAAREVGDVLGEWVRERAGGAS